MLRLNARCRCGSLHYTLHYTLYSTLHYMTLPASLLTSHNLQVQMRLDLDLAASSYPYVRVP